MPAFAVARTLPPPRAGVLPGASVRLPAAGLALEALLLGFILLYSNVPAGYTVAYGLNRPALAIFAALWPYPRLALAPAAFGVLAAALIVGLWLAYLAAAAALAAAGTALRRATLTTIAALAVLFNLTLVILLPPVHSADLYNYAMYGRLAARYGFNPYLVSGRAIPADPAARLAAWPDETSRYGPAWTLVAAAVSAAAGDDPLAQALAFKALAAAASLAAAALVYLLARRLGGDGARALLLFAWNPLVLVETAGNGHNDVVMIGLALLGLWLFLRQRPWAGAVAVALSVLVKYLSGILFLVLLARGLAQARTWRGRLAVALPPVAAGAAVAAACYAPFWAGPANLGRLLFGLSPGLNSLPNSTRVILDRLAYPVLVLLGRPPAADADADRLVALLLQAGFALLLIICLARIAHETSDRHVIRHWGLLTLVCLVLVYAAQYPWYLISPLAIAAIAAAGEDRAGKRLFAWTAACGFVFTLFYAWLLPGRS